MSLTRKIVINTAINLAGQGASYLLGAVSMIITMRYLGPELFGSYSLVLVFVGIVGGVAELGGQIILVREINQRPAEAPRIVGNFILLKAALYLLAFVLGLSAALLMGYQQDIIFLLGLGLLSMLFSFPISAGAVFQARLKMWYAVIINFSAKVISFGAVLLMIWLKQGLMVILWGNILVALLSSVVYWILIHREEKPEYRPDRGLILDLLRQSLPIGILLLVGGLVFRSDVLLLSKMSDASSLGLYTAAYKYVEWGLLIVTGLLISHLPVFSQYLATDPEKVRRLFCVSFELIGLFLIPVSVFVAVNAGPLISLVSGAAYTEADTALAVLIWVVLINSWNTMSSNMLIAGRKIGTLIMIYLPVMVVNLTVNYFGIPRYGYMMCAASSVLSEALAIIPLLVLMRKRYGISPGWLGSVKYLAVSAASAAAMLLVPTQNILARFIIFTAVWCLAGTLTGVLALGRFKQILSMVREQ